MADTPDIPTNPFQAYVPSREDPFGARRLGHVLRRCAFGADPQWLDRFNGKTPRDVIDWLLDYKTDTDEPFTGRLIPGLNFPFKSGRDVQNWWTYRMLESPRPFQERIALFWHGHFATAISKVEQAMPMHAQIELFRRGGLGNFRELLIAVGRDPAMLIWLDGRFNHKGKPNENYGREVMELFTLGIGHYTEQDVKQLARAFTGWELRNGEAHFNAQSFDSGDKTIFGQTGNFNDTSAVDLILSQPEAPRFIAWKLLREFVHPHPETAHINYYAARLTYNQWELKPVMRELLSSRLFFSDYAYRARIKSPADICIGGVRAVGGTASADFVTRSMSEMGQTLCNPPTVKGWDGDQNWINANTVLLRFNFGLAMATQRSSKGGDEAFAEKVNLFDHLTSLNLRTAEQIINHFAGLLHDDQLGDDVRQRLLDYMNKGQNPKVKQFVFDPPSVNSKVRGIIHLMMAMPEYQLC